MIAYLVTNEGKKQFELKNPMQICTKLGVSYDFGYHTSLDAHKPTTKSKYLKEVLKGVLGFVDMFYWRTDVVRLNHQDSNYLVFGLSSECFEADLNKVATVATGFNTYGDVIIVNKSEYLERIHNKEQLIKGI